MPIPPHADPFSLFADWYTEAQQCDLQEPTAMTLATADSNGQPSCRVILLKEHDARGFTFFTNRESNKGQQLKANAKAALCFYWMPLGRQVRVEGRVEEVTDAESDAYFASRRRGSQIGAWASAQSRPMEREGQLAERVKEREAEYDGQVVPRPPYWGGYRVVPYRIEFWQEQPFRLHDRLVYSRDSDESAWRTEILYP